MITSQNTPVMAKNSAEIVASLNYLHMYSKYLLRERSRLDTPKSRLMTWLCSLQRFVQSHWRTDSIPDVFHDFLTPAFKDVRAHCYRASLVRTPFIRHARATSFSSACTKSKTQQNIELMTFALTWCAWCANIFVGCSVTPTFFRQITSYSDSFHYY